MPMKYQRGVNLIEVLVTIVITSIGLLGLNSLQLQANRSTQDSGNRSQAVWMLEDVANRIRANNISVFAYDTGGAAVDCETVPARICSSYHDGSGRVIADVACTNDDMALSDLWEVACGFGAEVANSDLTRGSAVDFIANPELTIAVNASRQVTMTLSWDVRTGGIDANNQTVYASDSDSITTRRATITSVIQP